ncbi:MAG: hypothetical protein V3V08_23450 [Nannocystaceae bacterium]
MSQRATTEQVLAYVRASAGKDTRIHALEESCGILAEERDKARKQTAALEAQLAESHKAARELANIIIRGQVSPLGQGVALARDVLAEGE